jgi:hypothetical protein
LPLPAGRSGATDGREPDGPAELPHPATTIIAETRRATDPRISAFFPGFTGDAGDLPV